MNIKTVFSTNPVQSAVLDIRTQLKDFNPKLLVFFASSIFPGEEIAEQIEAAFPTAETIGCSTAGEIVTGKMLTKSVVAMAFNKEAVRDCKVEIVENLKKSRRKAFKCHRTPFRYANERNGPPEIRWDNPYRRSLRKGGTHYGENG